MSNEKKLFEIKEFWISLSVPIILATIFASIIAANSELTLDLSYNGFNKFIDIFKFPMGVLALIFPLVALVATNHRSRQSATQIKQGREQNTFSNFYKHKESFHNTERLEKRYDITFFEPDQLYSKIFPENSPEYLKYKKNNGDSDYISKIRGELLSVLEESSNIGFQNIVGISKSDQIKHFYEKIYYISQDLKFKANKGIYLCWSRTEMTAPDVFTPTSVTLEQRKGIFVDEFYVFGHVSLCDKVMRDLYGFYTNEEYEPAYSGSPLWLWDKEHEDVFKNCVKF
ncbi:hypothetical protein [Pseudomonas sp.]|uniref:hypothetical protein n=1 Tax=Pseudomonas sp. TaxID=306 RepID=UPI0023526C39|nr:hypothetical protein [Pseudomonas sp.]